MLTALFPCVIFSSLLTDRFLVNASHPDLRDTCIQLFFLNSGVLINPTQNLLVPEQRILGFQYPLVSRQYAITSQAKWATYVVFIGKRQELAIDPLCLQHIERRQSFRDRQSVVQLVVDDQMRCGPILQMACWIPFLVVLSIVPQCAIEVMVGEE